MTAPEQAAKDAGLRYVCDDQPGIRRVRAGRGFRYLMPDGSAAPAAQVKRIESLVIPPAWRDVWICQHANGHLQATGLDDRGRKQYRYHDEWTAARNCCKFDCMPAFGAALPRIRATVRRHIRLRGMPRLRVLAGVVRLLDQALIRVGNDEYARDNESYGLTTMRNGHVRVRGDAIHFDFVGKSGKHCDLSLQDRAAARIVRSCQELPGQELFGYVDDSGKVVDVGSGDINQYLLEITGERFTAKDFRTWGGTVIAAEEYARLGPPVHDDGRPFSARERKRCCTAAVKAAAAALHNTVATCRKFYVHPKLDEAYGDGRLFKAFEWAQSHPRPALLRLPERAVLRLIEHL